MKKFTDYRFRPEKRATFLQRILAYLCFVIVGIMIIGTAVAFTIDPHRLDAKKQTSPAMLPSRPAPELPESLRNQETFTHLGILRTGTGDTPSVPLAVEPWFYYDGTDIQFYQELQQKSRKMKAVVTEYFPQYTKQELQMMGEQSVKEQLKNAINQVLILGSIDRLYFNDYTFFD